jgi:hypothetical protein
MAYRVVLVALFFAFALATAGAVITTAKQVHDHHIASLERSQRLAR